MLIQRSLNIIFNHSDQRVGVVRTGELQLDKKSSFIKEE
jgi:hypothetical protein